MILKDFVPMGGEHCITHALQQIFRYGGHPLSEAMLFGLGEGLSFVYVNLREAPLISGRIKPLVFEENIARNLGISLRIRKPRDAAKAAADLKEEIRQDRPVMLYADMPYLSYLNMPPGDHFGGHSIVVFGFDEERQVYAVSDRDHSARPIASPRGPLAADFHEVPYGELARARDSAHRPFPARNKWVRADFSGFRPPDGPVLLAAAARTARAMLHPPARLLGVEGLGKFAAEAARWTRFDRAKRKRAGIRNFFMISSRGGTGGGAFRDLYGRFLQEAAPLAGQAELARFGGEFRQIARRWDRLAEALWALYERGGAAEVAPLPAMIRQIEGAERDLLTRMEAAPFLPALPD